MASNTWKAGIATENGMTLSGNVAIETPPLAHRLDNLVGRIVDTDRALDEVESRLLGQPSSYLAGSTQGVPAGIPAVEESVTHIEKLLNTLQERANRIVAHIG